MEILLPYIRARKECCRATGGQAYFGSSKVTLKHRAHPRRDFKVFSWSSTRLGSATGTQLLATLPMKDGSESDDAD